MPSDLPLAIITGAGRGIGQATAVELSNRGYRLALIARSQSELDQTARLCTQAETYALDVADPAAVQSLVEKNASRFGRIDAQINCAGLAIRRPIEQFSLEDWRATFDTNLASVFHFARALWPIWRKQGQTGGSGAVMVNLSSFSARDPFDGLGVYGAAKAALNLLGLALAREGKPIHVRVHTVAPAATDTAMLRSVLGGQVLPPENVMQPAEVARVIVQCVCGDLACTSGEVIYVHKS